MTEAQVDRPYSFKHTLTIVSVSAGMIGVCLTAIGLVKILARARQIETPCDDLIVIDAMIFGFTALLGFRGLRRFVHHQIPLSHTVMDCTFGTGLGLMVLIRGIFAWSFL